jgi:uncharacterized protein YfiM (DUF2279 family)
VYSIKIRKHARTYCFKHPGIYTIQAIRLGALAALIALSLISQNAGAQEDTLNVEVVRNAVLDTVTTTVKKVDSAATTGPNKKRVWTVAALHAGLYAGSMLALSQAWYADYPKSSFHTFDDSKEWLQVDKVGHTWTAYQISRASMASWKWAGLSRKQQIWWGGLSGAAFQTVIEVLDGFSAEWGWSWSDFAANVAGSGLLIGQELGWKEQRVSFKFSFHIMSYSDPMLNERSDDLFGSSFPERMLKDYNGQAYWLSANLKSFFKQSKIPAWLNVAVGYGGTGMFGGTENIWTDEETGITYDRTDIPRQRQWYLAPDIDFTRIKTNSKFVRSVLFCLNAFKMPAPALVLSDGKLVVHGFYF